jgi:hypothetical protein
MESENQAFKKYSSKIPRINIEIPGYKFFHSPSQLDNTDQRFLGRDQLIKRLKNILTNSESKSGSYLITGYRGMGKSSYVNQVLSQITLKKSKFFLHIASWFCIWLFISLFLSYKFPTLNKLQLISIIILIPFIIIIYKPRFFPYFSSLYNIIRKDIKTKNFKTNYIFFLIRNRIKKIKCFFSSDFREITIERRRRIVIRLNLGHEILDEKDIASLIAQNIEKEFTKFAYSFRRQFLFYSFKISLILLLFHFTSDVVIKQSVRTNNANATYVIENNVNSNISNEKAENKDAIAPNRLSNQNSLNITYNENKNNSINIFIKIYNEAIKDTKFVGSYLNRVYNSISEFINNILPKNLNIPTIINYLSIFYLLLIYVFVTIIFNLFFDNRYSSHSNRRKIIKKLKFLNTNIAAAVKVEKAQEIGKNAYYSFKKNQSQEYPIAEIRQIEKSLIDILDDIDKLIPIILKPEFIIVFDELDKIDPKNIKTEVEEENNDLTDFDISINGFSGGASNRARKQKVLKLLGNMKYFLTTAKAKFIFISGRELYDAFLADVSDREFSISSIFHEVIYVDSFLSDSSDQRKGDTVSMAEHYVCQFIMPEWYITYQKYKCKHESGYNALTLKKYREYLLKTHYKDDLNKEELDKVMLLLYQFVHYLMHVSNGAPKKINNLFERHIYSTNNGKINNNKDVVYIGKNNEKYYLSFGYLDQCKIGFIHYLSHPITMAIMNNVSIYGDKLLVSSSFLIDHIYKFHNNGFSWRNLENTPEVLDSSRTPELRSLINTIISYLTQTHLKTIVSGLYLFKFPKKVSEEIQFISKISEEASAIYNFSLDESLAVKRHYSHLLQHYTNQYAKEKALNGLENNGLLHSIANIHHILGDLHLLDENYTDAIFEYQNCLQFASLNFKEYDPHNDSHLIFIIRNMLKLGLAFEKRKTFNSAYTVYTQLISILIDFRYIDEKKLGLHYKIIETKDWSKYKAILYHSNTPEEKNKFILETKPAELKDWEKNSIKDAYWGNELITSLSKITTPLKNKITSRLSMFEDIRLMYQALLAKLFVLEKQQMGGITQSNLETLEYEFLYLHLATNLKDSFLISADFFKKLADILYYKNGLVTSESTSLFNALYFWDYDIENVIFKSANLKEKEALEVLRKISFFDFVCYFQENIKQSSNYYTNFYTLLKKYLETDSTFLNINRKEKSKNEDSSVIEDQINIARKFINKEEIDLSFIKVNFLAKISDCCVRREYLLSERNIAPCFACKYYNRSLDILGEYLLNKSEHESKTSKSIAFLRNLDNNYKDFNSTRANLNQTLASTLGGFGDIIISCSYDEDYIFPDFLERFFKYVHSNDQDKSEDEISIDQLENTHNDRIRGKLLTAEEIELEEDDCLLKLEIVDIYSNYVSNENSQLKDIFKDLDKELKDEQLTKLSSKLKEIKIKVAIDKLGRKKFKNISDKLRDSRNKESKTLLDRLNDIYHKGFSQLEKAMLYYLASAKYYKQSSNYREASFMYQKIIKLLVQYVESKPMYRSWIGNHIKEIEDQIVRRVIQNIYSSYEHIHIAEINKLKENEGKELYELINLNQLSLFPELEDVIYCYYRLAITCGNINCYQSNYFIFCKDSYYKAYQINIFDSEFDRIYNLPALSANRLNSSIYNRLISLRFKSFLNQKIFESITNYQLNEDTYEKNQIIIFYQKMAKAFEVIEYSTNFLANESNKNKDINGKFLNMIEFLILDSIFCLEKFIEIAFPHNETTLFTNTYVANIYKSLFEWTQLYDFLLLAYSHVDNKSEKEIKDKIENRITDLIPKQEKQEFKEDEDPFKNIDIFYKKESKQNRSTNLSTKLKNLVDSSNTYVVDRNYFAEMAIKKYQCAFAMHKEGKTYKDTIEGLYYLNDDLDNESFKFYLALERYRINTSDTFNKSRRLKDLFSDSTIFHIDKYVSKN